MSHRLEKINELIKHELGKVLLEEIEFGQGVLVTVLAVKTTPDLKDARAIFSVLPTQKGPVVLKMLELKGAMIQRFLNKKIRMRFVPQIKFVLNEDESESQAIEKILKSL